MARLQKRCSEPNRGRVSQERWTWQLFGARRHRNELLLSQLHKFKAFRRTRRDTVRSLAHRNRSAKRRQNTRWMS